MPGWKRPLSISPRGITRMGAVTPLRRNVHSLNGVGTQTSSMALQFRTQSSGMPVVSSNRPTDAIGGLHGPECIGLGHR
jgi:hypothetical protein